MNKCKACGVENKPGALLCEACGDPLEMNVATSVPAVAAPAIAVTDPQILRLIEGSKTAVIKEIDLPKDDFEFLLGRTDLDQGIIPDVDLTKFGEKVTQGADIGYTFSRKQATLTRRMGKLFLKAIGNARAMHLPKGDVWKNIQQNEEIELKAGDRVRFGGTEGYIIFEAV